MRSAAGFEYSDIELTADEVARVLRRGGKLRLLVHHSNGIVVRQSARRRAALQWIVEESGVFEKAVQLLGNVQSLSSAAATAWRQAAVDVNRLAADPVAQEVAGAVRQLAISAEGQWAMSIERPLSRLLGQARHELTILAAIDRVALDETGIGELVDVLERSGLEPSAPKALTLDRNVPFAWVVEAAKPA